MAAPAIIENDLPEDIWADSSDARHTRSTAQEFVDFLYFTTVSTLVLICLSVEDQHEQFKFEVKSWLDRVAFSNGPQAQAFGKHFEVLVLLIQMKKVRGLIRLL